MLNIKIRQCKIDEYKQLADIFVATFVTKPLPPNTIDILAQKFKALIKNQLTTFFVATEDGKFVALAGETKHRGCSYIGYVGVLPEKRRMGIGSRIFQKALTHANRQNKTVELFSNPGIEDMYRRFGFRDEFQTQMIGLIQADEKSPLEVKIASKGIPKWILNLDKEAVGFDRTQYLELLLDSSDAQIAYVDLLGYGIWNGQVLGPVIAKSDNVAYSLFDYFLESGPKRLLVPDKLLTKLVRYSPTRVQTCTKMTHGKTLSNMQSWVWSYGAFAMS